MEKSSYALGWRNYYFVDTVDKELEVLGLIDKALKKEKDYLYGLDIETFPLPGFEHDSKGGLSPHLSGIATIQLSLPKFGEVLFHFNKYSPGVVSPILRERLFKGTPVSHNAMFEYMHFKHVGIEFDNIHDSMLLARLYIQAKTVNFKITKSSLEAVVAMVKDYHIEKQSQKSNWGVVELSEDQKQYAVRDAYLCLSSFNTLLNLINKAFPQVLQFYRINRLAVPAIGDMVYHGVKIDEAAHNELIADWEKKYEVAEKELAKLLPTEINIGSPKQLSAWITDQISEEDYERWPKSEKTGLLKVNADTLNDNAHIPAIVPLLQVKQQSKKLSTYGKNLKTFVNPITGRAHPQYTQCYTGSGRLSSHSFNIQNNPRGDFRKIFIAEPGNILVGADYGMIEVRVYAHHSEDSTMLDGFERGLDMYKIVAALIAGKKIKDVTKEERQKAKAVLLGRLFLLGPNTLVTYAHTTFGVEMKVEEAKDLIARVDETFWEGAIWQKKQVERAKEILVVESKMGKIRVLEDDNYYNKSVNHPIQSDACAILLMALASIRKSLLEKEINGHLYCTVHDEIIIECKEEEEQVVSDILKRDMENAMLEMFPTATTVNLVDVKSGESWLELK